MRAQRPHPLGLARTGLSNDFIFLFEANSQNFRHTHFLKHKLRMHSRGKERTSTHRPVPDSQGTPVWLRWGPAEPQGWGILAPQCSSRSFQNNTPRHSQPVSHWGHHLPEGALFHLPPLMPL